MVLLLGVLVVALKAFGLDLSKGKDLTCFLFKHLHKICQELVRQICRLRRGGYTKTLTDIMFNQSVISYSRQLDEAASGLRGPTSASPAGKGTAAPWSGS